MRLLLFSGNRRILRRRDVEGVDSFSWCNHNLVVLDLELVATALAHRQVAEGRTAAEHLLFEVNVGHIGLNVLEVTAFVPYGLLG